MVLIKLTSPEIVSEGAFLKKTVKQLRSDITRLAVREIRKVLIASTYGKKWADWFSVQASCEATKAIITKDASIARTITPNLIVARGLGCLHGVLPMFPDRVYAKWGKTTGIPMGGTPPPYAFTPAKIMKFTFKWTPQRGGTLSVRVKVRRLGKNELACIHAKVDRPALRSITNTEWGTKKRKKTYVDKKPLPLCDISDEYWADGPLADCSDSESNGHYHEPDNSCSDCSGYGCVMCSYGCSECGGSGCSSCSTLCFCDKPPPFKRCRTKSIS